MTEKMKILQMLEDGKITAEEASKLLEAVSRGGHRRHRTGIDSEIVGDVMAGVTGAMGCIPMIMKHGHRLGSRGGKRTLSVKKRPTVRLSLVGGDLNLSASEDDSVRGNLSSGFLTAKDVRDELLVKCMGGDADIQLPRVKTISISAVGGDVKGDVEADDLTVKTLDGDVALNLKILKTACVKSKSGDIGLTIPESADAQVDAYTMSGDIEFEPKMDVEEETDNHIRGKMGEGTGDLTIRNLSGDIAVKTHKRD